MKNRLLPIGSIITVEGQDVMICAYLKAGAEIKGEHYDYTCCLYPNGIGQEAIMVKKEQIQKVKFIGFQDSRFDAFRKIMESQNA